MTASTKKKECERKAGMRKKRSVGEEKDEAEEKRKNWQKKKKQEAFNMGPRLFVGRGCMVGLIYIVGKCTS